MKHIVNFGAGVNSTALIIEMINRNMPIDYIIFADTGSEHPETYIFLEIMKRFFNDKKLPFVIVKSKYDCSIYDYYTNKKTMPFRKFRDCTDKFKKLPITKFIKQFKQEGVIQYIGIASDEARRIRSSDTKWIEFKYPLVSWMLNRKRCIEIIKNAGFIEPIKSGCFMCPYQSDMSWKHLLDTNKELWDKARFMEEQNRTYPKNTLRWKGTLKALERAKKEQHTITEFEGENKCNPKRDCDGFCML